MPRWCQLSHRCRRLDPARLGIWPLSLGCPDPTPSQNYPQYFVWFSKRFTDVQLKDAGMLELARRIFDCKIGETLVWVLKVYPAVIYLDTGFYCMHELLFFLQCSLLLHKLVVDWCKTDIDPVVLLHTTLGMGPKVSNGSNFRPLKGLKNWIQVVLKFVSMKIMSVVTLVRLQMFERARVGPFLYLSETIVI